MFALVRARSVSRSIAATLAPFRREDVAVSLQLGATSSLAVPSGDWLHPRVLGFLSMVVTLLAERRAAHLPDHALASVQSSVLNAITGAGGELIGAELCLLSSSDDADFLDGAAAGLGFFHALEVIDPASASREGQTWNPGFAEPADVAEFGAADDDQHRRYLQALWDQHVTLPLAGARR